MRVSGTLNWKRSAWILAISVLFAAALYVGLTIWPAARGGITGPPGNPESVQEFVQMDTLRLTRRVFSCGHDMLSTGVVDPSWIGLNRARLETRLPGLLIEEFSTDRILLQEQRGEICPDCHGNEFIGVRDGYVAVYSGTPEKPGPVLQTTRIPVALLPDSEQTRIMKGIIVNGREERLQVLEGLSEYKEREP